MGNFLLSLTFINNKDLIEKLRISKLLILIIESKKVNKSGSQQHNNINLDAFTIIPFSSKTLSHSLFGFIGFIIYKEEEKNLNHENFVEASQKGKNKVTSLGPRVKYERHPYPSINFLFLRFCL